jgi:hypothetical protein
VKELQNKQTVLVCLVLAIFLAEASFGQIESSANAGMPVSNVTHCRFGQCRLNGQYNDSSGFVWKLAAAGTLSSYRIKGHVNTTSVGGTVYSVLGHGSGINFNMTATNLRGKGKLCSSFTYVGTLRNYNGTFASGTWSDVCGNSGNFTMIKVN